MEISEELQYAAESIGIKLEMVGGIPVWEALPILKHQKTFIASRIPFIVHREPMEMAADVDVYRWLI